METTQALELPERAVPPAPKRKGPKPRCEHGNPPERCGVCYLEELEEASVEEN